MQTFRENPYATIQTCYWLASSLAFLRICDVLEGITKAVSVKTLGAAEKVCAAAPWLYREQATLKDGSKIWIGPVLNGRNLVDYYATLPEVTHRERFHLPSGSSLANYYAVLPGGIPKERFYRHCAAPKIRELADKLDSGLIHVIGAYDHKNKLIGTAEAIPLCDPTKVEANFSVHPEYQKLGLGGYLVNACLRQCAVFGYKIVIAEVEAGEKSARVAKFFPKEGRVVEGCDIALFLNFDKHPEIFQGFLAQARALQQSRLMGRVPEATNGAAKMVASLACS